MTATSPSALQRTGHNKRMKAKDITGLRVGHLTVLSRAGKQGGISLWRCKCDCGRETVRQLAALTSGSADRCAPCGRSVRNTRHGLSQHPLYRRWSNIRSRCEDPNNKDFVNYGARGIRLCVRWLNPVNFIEDVQSLPGYFPGASLDREDNDGPYAPGNVRWADAHMQAMNRRSTRNGEQ